MVILDNDMRYMENLAAYVTSYYRHRFNLMTFSGSGELTEYIQQKEVKVDILLAASDESGVWQEKMESGLLIILANGAPGEMQDGLCRVNRYCGADRLIAEILTLYAGSGQPAEGAGGVREGRDNKIIVAASAEGGAGKTSVAIALCSHFSRVKLKSLYMDFEYLGAGNFIFGGEAEGGLSDIVYTLKARPERLGLKLEALARAAPGYGFYYYTPPYYPMDIDEIQPAEIEALVARFRGMGIYDRIIIDTHCGISVKNKSLMELADDIFIIARCDGPGVNKCMLFLEQIKQCFGGLASGVYKRCHVVLNRDAGGAEADEAAAGISGAYAIRVSKIPYCDSVAGGYSPESLCGISSGFGAAVAEIAHRI